MYTYHIYYSAIDDTRTGSRAEALEALRDRRNPNPRVTCAGNQVRVLPAHCRGLTTRRGRHLPG